MRIGRTGFATGYVGLTGVTYAITTLTASSNVKALLFALFVLFPAAVLATFRSHDIGRSPFATFWRSQIPVIGPLLGLYELATKPGTAGDNDFGQVPKF